MESVYLETTVIGMIASRDHADTLVLARQVATRKWWSDATTRFQLHISDLVIAECSAGDPTAADERLRLAERIDILATSDAAEMLTDALLAGKAVPKAEPRDAAHIALAAVHGMDFLVTWNFRHILNPHTQRLIEAICRDAGYMPATICTPEQLLETNDDT